MSPAELTLLVARLVADNEGAPGPVGGERRTDRVELEASLERR